MAARKKKRELSEKAQKRIRQRNLHVGITVIAAIVIIFSVIQFTLWRYVSKVDDKEIRGIQSIRIRISSILMKQ